MYYLLIPYAFALIYSFRCEFSRGDGPQEFQFSGRFVVTDVKLTCDIVRFVHSTMAYFAIKFDNSHCKYTILLKRAYK